MYKCTHEDCFTCPYADCIAIIHEPNGKKNKRGRKATMTPEERAESKRKWMHNYYQLHKDEIQAKRKEKAREKGA